MKKILFITLFIFLSCEKDNNQDLKIIPPKIQNFELKNINKRDFQYIIKANKAIDKNNHILAEKVSLIFIKNDNKFIGKSDSIELTKLNNNIKLKNIDLIYRDLKITSDFLEFNEKLGIIDSRKILIRNNYIDINGHNLKSDNKLKIFTIKNVKSRIKF